MPTSVMDSTVQLFGFNELLAFATEQTGLPTASVLGAINAETRSRFFNSSLTWDEAQSTALANWMETQGFSVEYNGNQNWTSSVFQKVVQMPEAPSVTNSNTATVSRGTLRQMYGNIKEFDGQNHFMQMTRFPASGGLGSKALYVVGSVSGAVSAASTGIWLGKQISPLLYQANPNFWESIGVTQGAFQPENWASITNGDDSPFAGLFNFILGIDPETGTAQTYMDQNALAYLAYALKTAGFFDTGFGNIPVVNGTSLSTDDLILGNSRELAATFFPTATNLSTIVQQGMADFPYGMAFKSNGLYFVYGYANGYPSFSGTTTNYNANYKSANLSPSHDFRILNSKIWGYPTSRGDLNMYTENLSGVGISGVLNNNVCSTDGMNGALVATKPIAGISNQPGATLPDTTNWNDIASTLASLQSQYPDSFNNALVWNADDPSSNTSGATNTWVPVPFPVTTSATDTQPVSGTQTQTSLDLSTVPDTVADTVTDIAQQVEIDAPTIPPLNPPDTGEGDSPIPVPPTGAASALWSVYHPTQAQVNSFGAWLWGSPFLTNIGKLFQNPIEGVISLHKIFAPPVDSGTGNIVVGTLDSGVSSATVNQQYVRVDCGSVRCLEQFANVLDYSPHTSVSLYLPFIGIVPLDTDDVMRSTIHVIYGVDVFTGACLAMVEVSRDSHTINMYQYAGTASVEYPLSNVQHAQLMNGIMGIAGGIGLTIASGGAMSPVVAAGAAASIGGGIANAARSNVGRSGSFSGNSGAMGIKKPYLIIQRPQSKVAQTFRRLSGLPTNKSIKLGSCSDFVRVKHVNVTIAATDTELEEIESLLKAGVLV